MLEALLVGLGTFWIVGLAEFGDKTHLVTLSLMAKTKQPWVVALGATVGIVGVTVISVVLGIFLGDTLPTNIVTIGAALLFIALGVITLILKNGEQPQEDAEAGDTHDETNTMQGKLHVLRQASIFVALAEFGDKSQLIILTAATASFPLAVFIGGSLGMAIIFVLSAVFGELLVERVDKDILEYSAAALFIIAGIWLLLS